MGHQHNDVLVGPTVVWVTLELAEKGLLKACNAVVNVSSALALREAEEEVAILSPRFHDVFHGLDLLVIAKVLLADPGFFFDRVLEVCLLRCVGIGQ